VKRRYKIGLGITLGAAIGLGLGVWAQTANFQVLDARGEVADKQLELLIFASLLSLVVIIPVFTLLGVIAWKYREGNKKATYLPNWGGNAYAEAVWWGIPCVLIGILSVVIWNSSHALDPYRPLESSKEPVNVQVVSLQWRWLFIYPDEGVASVNHFKFPEDTPVNFTISADSPMNSFWIPNLGGQVYAMNGMSTKLHLMAHKEGEFKGATANISGEGYSKMNFVATATSDVAYRNWIKQLRSEPQLDWGVYQELAKPVVDTSKKTYSLADRDLYAKIINKYMPDHGSHGQTHGHGE
jgi:cytochrome o ubiquinol oxidase subunit II